MSYAAATPTFTLNRHTPFRRLAGLACGSAAFALGAWTVVAAAILLG